MIITYQDGLRKYKSSFYFQKALRNGEIERIERGLYISKKNKDYTNFEYIVSKFPNMVFTMESAFFYYGMLKDEPKFYHLASRRTSVRLKTLEVKNAIQYYQLDKLFKIGITLMKVNGIIINIYDKERLLIELVRNKKKISEDLYKKIIQKYKESNNIIDEKRLIKYNKKFKMSNKLITVINEDLNRNLVI